MRDENMQGWGPPHPPSSGGMRRVGAGVVGVLGGWAVAYGFGRLTYLIAGESLWVVAVSGMVLLACVVAGPMVAVRRWDLHHRRP